MRDKILEHQTNMEAEQLTASPPLDGPLRYVAKEVQDAMEEFQEIGCLDNKLDVNDLIS